jgi:pyruvate kinase
MRAKIIATIGPRSSSYEIMRDMALAGMDMVRLNFSHASAEQFLKAKDNVEQIKKETGKNLLILQDLQGPRIRVGLLSGGEVKMHDGEIYVLKYGHCDPTKKEIPIDNEEIISCVAVGDPLFLANGMIELSIVDLKDGAIITRVEKGGVLLSRKGINLPKTSLKSGGLTPKDEEDALFGAKNGADFIALSFVQSREDVDKLRSIIKSVSSRSKIIAKIERGVALKNIDSIIESSDGIMIARGDLGIETPIEEVPIIQKNLIRHAHWHKKPAIVATEMLSSMIERNHPTRAEVADIANAVFDGADALMLSDETAAGHYPVEAVRYMLKTIEKTDNYIKKPSFFSSR